MTALMLNLPGDYPATAKMLIGYSGDSVKDEETGALIVLFNGTVPMSTKILVQCPSNKDIIIRVRKAGIVPIEMIVTTVGEYMELDLPSSVADPFYGVSDVLESIKMPT